MCKEIVNLNYINIKVSGFLNVWHFLSPVKSFNKVKPYANLQFDPKCSTNLIIRLIVNSITAKKNALFRIFINALVAELFDVKVGQNFDFREFR